MRKVPILSIGFVVAICSLTGCAAAEPEAQPQGTYPLSEYAERVASCLRDKGWDAIADFDNSVSSGDSEDGIPTDQLSAYQADSKSCRDELGYTEPRIPTADQIRALYPLEVAERDCLIALGFDIPQLPSEQRYIETFGTDGAWDIGAQVPMFSSQDEYERVWTACPPPLWFPPW